MLENRHLSMITKETTKKENICRNVRTKKEQYSTSFYISPKGDHLERLKQQINWKISQNIKNNTKNRYVFV